MPDVEVEDLRWPEAPLRSEPTHSYGVPQPEVVTPSFAEEEAPAVRPRRTGRTVLIVIVAVAIVLAIIFGIRLASDKANGGLSPQTITQNTGTVTVTPATRALQANFLKYSQPFQSANAIAKEAFTKSGSQTALPILVNVATTYGSAVKVYAFELHFIVWPAALNGAIQNEYTQLASLMNYLSTADTVTAASEAEWFTQLHTVATTAQQADNNVRVNIQLPKTTAFPTS